LRRSSVDFESTFPENLWNPSKGQVTNQALAGLPRVSLAQMLGIWFVSYEKPRLLEFPGSLEVWLMNGKFRCLDDMS
jgi:hypothetical protein